MEERSKWRRLTRFEGPVAEAIKKQSLSLAVRKIGSRNVVLALCEDIMRAEHNPLPENVAIGSLTKGGISAPDSLK